MNACHGYYWCETCDEPAQSSCRKSKKHHVKFVLDTPVRNAVTVDQKRQEEHTHRFAPASVTLDPVEAAARFELMRKQLSK